METVLIPVMAEKVGTLIGHEGCMVKQIKKLSKTTISIKNGIAKITGMKDNVAVAKGLIKIVVAEDVVEEGDRSTEVESEEDDGSSADLKTAATILAMLGTERMDRGYSE